MDQLPPEIIKYIFEFVPIKNVMQLKVISKRWKQIIDQLIPESIAMIEGYSIFENKSSLHQLVIKDIELFLSIKLNLNLKKVKKLFFIIKDENLINPTKFLNQFNQLEILTIDLENSTQSTPSEICLELNELKKIKISNFCYLIKLFTPKLIKMSTNCDLNKLTLSHNEKLKYLKICESLELNYLDKIIEFINLEILIIKYAFIDHINRRLLQNLINLKELHVIQLFIGINNINSLFNFELDNLKIFINGLELKHWKLISSNPIDSNLITSRLEDQLLNYVVQNYNQIDRLNGYCTVQYNELSNQMNNKITDNFIMKVKKIYNILVFDHADDEFKLIDFMSKTEATNLCIDVQVISLTFFDQLIRCTRIKSLDLFSDENANLLSDKFLAISNLLNLKHLTIFNCKLSEDKINFLIKMIKLSKSIINIRLCDTLDDLNEAIIFDIFEYNLNTEKYLNFGIERIGLEVENDLFNNIVGLKLNRLIIHGPIESGSSIWLFCDFKLDIAEQRAFTSKFYKNNIEFYRYSISNDQRRPSKKYFNQPAVNVNIQKSNGSHVFLESVVPMTEGTFSCEINTDEPFFMSMQAQQDLRVYVLPKKRLHLVNVKDNYRDGELINIQCRSSPSKPSVVLRWHINNQQITKNEENLNITYQIFDHDSIDSGLSYSVSNLTFYLCTNTSRTANNLKARKCTRSNRIGQLLKQSNAIYIRCSGVLSQIKDESSEELIVEEKGQNSRFEQTTNSDQVKPPKIENNQNLNYQIGELLQLNCSSPIGLPAAYLEWFVNNKRINEQYVYNYAEITDHQQTELNELSNHNFDNLRKNEIIKNNRLLSNEFIINSNEQTISENNSYRKSSKLIKSSNLNYKKQTRKNEPKSNDLQFNKMKDFQNDYLFSNNLKKLNLLSIHQRNKNNLTTSQNLIGQALQFDNLTFLNHPNLSFINQPTLYNHNVNLTRLQNIIYQHYSDYSFKPSSHKIGIKFRVMKKHYQTLDLFLRVKCVATYGKIIIQDQTTIALFADGHSYHTSQYFNALEISAASYPTYSSFIPAILILFVHLIRKKIH